MECQKGKKILFFTLFRLKIPVFWDLWEEYDSCGLMNDMCGWGFAIATTYSNYRMRGLKL